MESLCENSKMGQEFYLMILKKIERERERIKYQE